MTPIAAGLRTSAASRFPRVTRVVELDALASEEERPVEILLHERLGADPLGDCGGLGRTGVLPLEQRQHPSGDRNQQE